MFNTKLPPQPTKSDYKKQAARIRNKSQNQATIAKARKKTAQLVAKAEQVETQAELVKEASIRQMEELNSIMARIEDART